MPNTKQAEKRLRQDEKKRVHNKSIKSSARKQVRKVLESVEAGDIEKAEGSLSLAAKKLQKASKGNVFHKNKASRTLSRLSKKVNNLKKSK